MEAQGTVTPVSQDQSPSAVVNNPPETVQKAVDVCSSRQKTVDMCSSANISPETENILDITPPLHTPSDTLVVKPKYQKPSDLVNSYNQELYSDSSTDSDSDEADSDDPWSTRSC